MATIKEAKRLIKRVILSNLTTENNSLYLTPMLSGKHGIGKSQIVALAAKDLNGICITIEGGTLKEGEITGLPYQYEDKEGNVNFNFLPYYAIKRIQEKEKEIFNLLNLEKEYSTLEGKENVYSLNDIPVSKKIELLETKQIQPVFLFIDELNRTDNAVYRELMNIILTKTVNGYKLPWWVFFVAAINPSNQNSMYATNEMDPAQLDRFIKIKVKENTVDWVTYALDNNFDNTIIEFIANNEIYLSVQSEELEDSEPSTPSPRGWEMLNTILKSKDMIKPFFTKEELLNEEDDIRTIIYSKVGSAASVAYYSSLKENTKLVTARDIYNYEEEGISKEILELLKKQSTARNAITNKNMIEYLMKNYDEDAIKHNNEILEKTKNYMDTIDKSSRLIFAQYLTNNVTKNNTSLYEKFYEIFDESLIKLIYDNMDNSEVIVNETNN